MIDASQRPTSGRPKNADFHSHSHPGLPLRDPLQSLPPTARWILQSARRLLVERGFEALTLDNVAAEAQEAKTSIQRYFGSKAGLIEILFDSLVHDAYAALRNEAVRQPPGEARLKVYLGGLVGIEGDIEAWRAFYEIAPHALRDPELRQRLASMYDYYRELTLKTCGISRSLAMDDEQQRGLAALILAMVDGIAFQVVLDPERFDPAPAFDVLFTLVREHLVETPD